MSDLWAFALSAWRRPGVEAAALRLQDDFELSASLLLTGVWLGARGVPAEPLLAGRLQEVAANWERERIGPLRRLRRGAAANPSWQEWKRLLQEAELEAERLLLGVLEQQVSEHPQAPGADSVHAWLMLLVPASVLCVEQTALLDQLVQGIAGATS